MKLKLRTTVAQFHSLHEQADAAPRRKSPMRLDREVLMNLLMDHSAMIARLVDQVELQEK